MTRTFPLTLALLAVALTAGCASYRTNSDIEFDSTDLGERKPVIPVGKVDTTGRQTRVIGPVVATVKKLTVNHDDPTREMADIVLAHKAKEMGADAVINVKYEEPKIVVGSWGELRAEGTAIKFLP